MVCNAIDTILRQRLNFAWIKMKAQFYFQLIVLIYSNIACCMLHRLYMWKISTSTLDNDDDVKSVLILITTLCIVLYIGSALLYSSTPK